MTVYQQILSAIFMYAMESLSLTPQHLRKLDTFYFRVLRTAMGKKSSYYHRVLRESNIQCSNAYLQAKLWNSGIEMLTPSQQTQSRQLALLGHCLRNPSEPISSVCFNQLGIFRGSSREYRQGAPRLHWNETTSTLAMRRIDYLNPQFSKVPSPKFINHPYYAYVDRSEIQTRMGHSALQRTVVPVTVMHKASNRNFWKRII